LASSERAFHWRSLELLPKREPRVVAGIRPDAMADQDCYRAQCFLGKWHRDLAGMEAGSGRHNALLTKARAAGGLVAAGLLTFEQAYEALWSACELNGLTRDPGGSAERTLRDGLEYGAQTPWMPDDLPDSPVWRTRYESSRMGRGELSTGVSGPAHIYITGPDTTHQSVFEPRTAAAIGALALPDIEWIAEPWLVAGCLTEVDGKPKAAGKTTWALDLIRAVTRGELFLGQETLRCPVLLLSEQNDRSLQQALQRAGVLESRDLHVVMRHEVGEMRWSDIVGEAATYCRKVGARVLVIDTLAPWVGLRGDAENNSGDALLAVQPLQEACARDGLGILFMRHERKSGGDVGDSGRGSSAYAGAVDIILSLRRGNREMRPTVRQLESLSRSDETPPRMVIELQGGRYVALSDNGELAFTEVQYQIVSALKDRGRLRAMQFKEFVSVGRTQLYFALNALTERGVIRREVTHSGSHEYVLPADDDDQEQDVFDV
jgi:hypothetical protein